jgi:hypothetical protein
VTDSGCYKYPLFQAGEIGTRRHPGPAHFVRRGEEMVIQSSCCRHNHNGAGAHGDVERGEVGGDGAGGGEDGRLCLL